MAKKKRGRGRPQLAKNKLLSRRVFVKLTAAHHHALADMARDRETTVGELSREILVTAVSIDLERKQRIAQRVAVFHFEGKKIGITRWRDAFIRACKASGRSALTHDCRRTAARALERAGVPRSVAMKLIGHKTEQMYKRYRIVDERDLDDAVEKLDEYFQRQSTTAEKRIVVLQKKSLTL